jgi:GTPase
LVQFNEEEFDNAYETEINLINDQLGKEIVFAMIGDVNSGKSSTINKLIGKEDAKVGAKPGATVGIDRYLYKGIIFADTPGLDDINKKNSEETYKFYKEADIILFFLNAAGTVFSEGEKKSFDKIKKVNKNIIIVLNKIDAADDISNLVSYIRKHSKNKFEIVPISSRTGENIDELRGAILDILKRKKKDILFAKKIKEKSAIANKWIVAAATSAGAVGASLIPGSDKVHITSIQVGLMVKLATLYEKPISKERAKELTITSLTGNVGKSLFRQVVKLIPGAGSLAGAGVASGMTLTLGYALKYAYENDINLDAETLGYLYKAYKKAD